MAIKVTRMNVWAAGIEDKPGGLASKLGQLSRAGADFEFAFARREPAKRGAGVVFLTPIKGAKQLKAAKAAGFDMIHSVHSVCIEGPDRPGMATAITQKLAAANVNLRGFSAAGIGGKSVMYLAFDDAAEADKAVRVLKKK
jgi:hypothetical protein